MYFLNSKIFQTDVIVNTTAADLNLSAGGVSKAILNAAGPALQQEANNVNGGSSFEWNRWRYEFYSWFQAAPGGIPRNQLVETSGGKIKGCQKIYHLCLPRYSDKEGIRVSVHQRVKKWINTRLLILLTLTAFRFWSATSTCVCRQLTRAVTSRFRFLPSEPETTVFLTTRSQPPCLKKCTSFPWKLRALRWKTSGSVSSIELQFKW